MGVAGPPTCIQGPGTRVPGRRRIQGTIRNGSLVLPRTAAREQPEGFPGAAAHSGIQRK